MPRKKMGEPGDTEPSFCACNVKRLPGTSTWYTGGVSSATKFRVDCPGPGRMPM
jgi:hypothetical protein